jgi:ribosomal protein S3
MLTESLFYLICSYMIKTGHAGQVYTDTAVRHVMMRQGVIGIRVSIFLPQDPKGIMGPKIPLDDVVTIMEPKEEIDPVQMLAAQAAQQQAAAMAAAAAPPMEAAPVADPAMAAGF